MTIKIHTVEHERWNSTEKLHRRTLTVVHDRNMDEYLALDGTPGQSH